MERFVPDVMAGHSAQTMESGSWEGEGEFEVRMNLVMQGTRCQFGQVAR